MEFCVGVSQLSGCGFLEFLAFWSVDVLDFCSFGPVEFGFFGAFDLWSFVVKEFFFEFWRFFFILVLEFWSSELRVL